MLYHFSLCCKQNCFLSASFLQSVAVNISDIPTFSKFLSFYIYIYIYTQTICNICFKPSGSLKYIWAPHNGYSKNEINVCPHMLSSKSCQRQQRASVIIVEQLMQTQQVHQARVLISELIHSKTFCNSILPIKLSLHCAM